VQGPAIAPWHEYIHMTTAAVEKEGNGKVAEVATVSYSI
jgi:hypothetical protein